MKHRFEEPPSVAKLPQYRPLGSIDLRCNIRDGLSLQSQCEDFSPKRIKLFLQRLDQVSDDDRVFRVRRSREVVRVRSSLWIVG